MGLALGLAVLILLQFQRQPAPKSTFAQDVAALGRTIENTGFSHGRELSAVLNKLRVKGRGRIAWIQLHDSNGTLVAQAGRVSPLESAGNSVVLKSYRVPLANGDAGTLDVAYYVQARGSKGARRRHFSASVFI